MYDVSELYKLAIAKNQRDCKVTGTIITNIGTTIALSDTNISAGSLYVEDKCVSGEELMLGSVYTAELGVSIDSEIDRYTLFGAKISFTWSIKIDSTNYEDIPLGEYSIYTADRVGKFINIKAYDNMTKTNTGLDIVTTGTPFEIMSFIATGSDLLLGQTEAEINALAPAGFIFTYNDLTGIDSYRDLLSMAAIALGGFAKIDRLGKLIIRRFGKTSVTTIDDRTNNRSGAKFSDFVNKYSRVVININGETYYSGDDSFMTMVLPTLNICDGVAKETVQTLVDNILLHLPIENEITPFSASYNGDPSIDLGDLITNTGFGTPVGGLTSLVTSSVFRHKAKGELKCVGKNPKLADVKTAVQKAIAQSSSETVKAASNIVLTYTNAKVYDIKTSFVSIIYMKFIMLADAVPTFTAQVLVDVTKAGTFEVNYQLNGDTLNFKPKQLCNDVGKYMLNLFLPITGLEVNTGNALNVVLKS